MLLVPPIPDIFHVSILLNTQYIEVRNWLYDMLKGIKQNQQTPPTHWCPGGDVFVPPFAIATFLSSFSFVSVIFPPFWIGDFPLGLFRGGRWCALPVAWRPYIDVVSFISRQNWRSYSCVMRLLIIVQLGSEPVCWRVEGEVLSVSEMWCSVHWAWLSIWIDWAILSIFEGSILLILSNTHYFRGVDTTSTKQFVVLSGGRYYFY